MLKEVKLWQNDKDRKTCKKHQGMVESTRKDLFYSQLGFHAALGHKVCSFH